MLPTSAYLSRYLNFGVNPYDIEFCRQISELQVRCNFLETQNAQLKQVINDKTPQTDQRRKQRRSTESLEKKYCCPYTGCKKIYGSDLALNLHVKNKHNGGTKTYRETVARQIVLAEQKGDPMPYVSINFPPNYLKEFRKRFFQGI